MPNLLLTVYKPGNDRYNPSVSRGVVRVDCPTIHDQGDVLKVLITGGAGFIGSVLTQVLIDNGHTVRVVDRGFFGLDHVDDRAEVIDGDILDFNLEWLDAMDAVVHLAGLSNDPLAAF